MGRIVKNDSSKYGIIVFTRDRPESLKLTINDISGKHNQIIILDDSRIEHNRIRNEQLQFEFSNIFYHGPQQQMKLIQDIGRDLCIDSPFLRPLGTEGWNLGYCRNWALILCAVEGFERVVFLDDDIRLTEAGNIDHQLILLSDYDFVGSKIMGMPDESFIGHLFREIGIEFEGLPSGGFLAFKPKFIHEAFINVYNEDWIWQRMHPEAISIVSGSSYQNEYDPFTIPISKIHFQEFGEILYRGLDLAFSKKNASLLNKNRYWTDIIESFKKELDELNNYAYEIGPSRMSILKEANLLDYYNSIDPDNLTKVYTEYYSQKKGWLSLLEFARRIRGRQYENY